MSLVVAGMGLNLIRDYFGYSYAKTDLSLWNFVVYFHNIDCILPYIQLVV